MASRAQTKYHAHSIITVLRAPLPRLHAQMGGLILAQALEISPIALSANRVTTANSRLTLRQMSSIQAQSLQPFPQPLLLASVKQVLFAQVGQALTAPLTMSWATHALLGSIAPLAQTKSCPANLDFSTA